MVNRKSALSLSIGLLFGISLFPISSSIAQSESEAKNSGSTQANLPVNPPVNTQSPTTIAEEETETDLTPAPAEKNVDPYEKINRAMFGFNNFLDHWILHPIAKGYDKVTPSPIRKGVTNFFANVDMLTTIPNDLLQGKTAYFTADVWRFMINTTLGVGGLFDVATRVGLPKHHEDFGMTLAYWGGPYGLKPQPYVVLPLFGSSTTRDAFAKIPNAATWPFNYIEPQYYNYGALALNVVSKRADLLPADQLVKDAFDPYIFVRSAYLQSRNREIEKNKYETNFPPYTTEPESTPTEDDNSGNEL
jgi:phospholipid-binding lipoprotein MlaA